MNFFFKLSLIFLALFQLTKSSTEEEPEIKRINKTEWTVEDLVKYTIEEHGKENYFISDPYVYILEEEKEVIYYRLESLYTKMNLTSIFFVVNKISTNGLNLTFEDEEDDDDEIVKGNSTNINDTTKNKTEEDKVYILKTFIAEVRKKLFNRKIFEDKESKSLIGIITVEDLGKYVYVGKDFEKENNNEEINELLDRIDLLIEKGDLYTAVDNFFNNLNYRHQPSLMDKFNKFMGGLGELIGIAAIFISYSLMNRNNGQREQPTQQQNGNKKENKKNENKKEEKAKDEKGENKKDGKEKKD